VGLYATIDNEIYKQFREVVVDFHRVAARLVKAIEEYDKRKAIRVATMPVQLMPMRMHNDAITKYEPHHDWSERSHKEFHVGREHSRKFESLETLFLGVLRLNDINDERVTAHRETGEKAREAEESYRGMRDAYKRWVVKDKEDRKRKNVPFFTKLKKEMRTTSDVAQELNSKARRSNRDEKINDRKNLMNGKFKAKSHKEKAHEGLARGVTHGLRKYGKKILTQGLSRGTFNKYD
jgi:hypothetical protein